MAFEMNVGSRAQVWHGTAKKTSGGLTKDKLMMNKHGRIVSRRKHNTAKREKRLEKALKDELEDLGDDDDDWDDDDEDWDDDDAL